MMRGALHFINKNLQLTWINYKKVLESYIINSVSTRIRGSVVVKALRY